ncbi:N-acylneuraminate cytidylyltransferase [Sagittula marina]|uniref:N-acylneuraminate cytidylyltransferase n=1 Tax=Sagittula marina TaxID=943940 RepID=A0A7W6GTF7_9RHOB|nr:pseudaminic acid cytidylyltransferase [Sagittula marina]MBB3985159.1 N-acylneuraminate cytidylyltransferase [Sagittula marina]
MTLCVIPARGGSKRIPRKNIRPFLGRPMIAWSIAAAQEAGVFDRIVVSTDDPEIADCARAEGAEVPFVRAAELSDDTTPTVPVIADAIAQVSVPPDTPVCCLYATAPFVTAAALKDGLSLLNDEHARSVVSVTSYPFPIQRALSRDDDGRIAMVDPGLMQTRSQDLPERWHDAGQFYWASAGVWASGGGMFDTGAHGLVLPRHRVQDIDTEEDWQRAEFMMQALQAAEG